MNKTWTKFIEENLQPKIVSFDFDGTMTNNQFVAGPYSTVYDTEPNHENIAKLKDFKKKGYRVYIVTRRLKTEDSIKEIVGFVRAFKLPIDGLHFTNLEDKVHTLLRLGVSLHFDDDPQEIEAIKQFGPHIDYVKINEDGSAAFEEQTESYQQKLFKKHTIQKKRLIGLGGNKIKSYPGKSSFRRSLSAPPNGE